MKDDTCIVCDEAAQRQVILKDAKGVSKAYPVCRRHLKSFLAREKKKGTNYVPVNWKA